MIEVFMEDTGTGARIEALKGWSVRDMAARAWKPG
jgi:hypothetical protein